MTRFARIAISMEYAMAECNTPENSSVGQKCVIAVLAVVKNEEDIIELFIRHAFSFCDRVYICDHNSADRTVEIIHALVAEGLDIRLSHSTATGYPQEQITHGLLKCAVSDGADWIFPLDADEFPVSETGTLRENILSLDPDIEWRYVWRNFYFSDKTLLDNPNFFSRFDIFSDSIFGKCVFHTKLFKSRFCRITNGNHFLKYAAKRHIPPVRIIPNIKLAHFPARTLGRIVWKNINFGILINPNNRRNDEILNTGWMNLDLKYISELYASGSDFSFAAPPIAEIVTRYTKQGRFASDEHFVIAQVVSSYRDYHERAVRTGLKRFRKLDRYRELLRYGIVATIGTIWNVLRRAHRRFKSAHGQQLTSGMGGFYVNFPDI